MIVPRLAVTTGTATGDTASWETTLPALKQKIIARMLSGSDCLEMFVSFNFGTLA